MKPFDELRVVEIAGAEAGAYAAKLFADFGATVLKIEPPGGDTRRSDGEPWRAAASTDEASVGSTWAYLNTSKQSHVVNLSSAAGEAELADLLKQSDVVIESAAPDPLLPRSASIEAPQLVKTWISPFGVGGPYSEFRSNTFTDEAIGGHLYLNGEPDREPIQRPGLHSAYQAGTHAFIGTMAALWARERIGKGQTVEIAHFDGFASLHQHTTTMWSLAGHMLMREGNRQPGQWHPVGVYPCRDGYVQLSLPAARMVEPFLQAAGLGELLDDPRFATDAARATHKDEFDAAILPWLMAHTVDEIVELGQAVRTPVGPVPGMLELSRDPHLTERAYWAELQGSPDVRVPRGPFRISDHEGAPTAPPTLDSFDATSLAGWEPPAAASSTSSREPPLAGVRILDLTRVWAGPFAGRMLADLGADVILVEMPWGRGPREVPPELAQVMHLYPENETGERPWNRNGGFNKLARNRRGITLNLSHAKAQRLFRDLVATSDVVLENYSPRVMANFGLDFEGLRAINPNIISASMPGYGRSGPNRDWVAFGPLIEASAGLNSVMGYADSGPYRSGIAWPDPVAGMNGAAAVMVALWDRAADPESVGREVEVAMIEAMGSFVGDQLVAAQARGSDAPRRGNRDPNVAPQGVYPCAGADRWIAISITNDDEWRALCAQGGLDEFASLGLRERQAQHDAIDTALAAWTRHYDANGLMYQLQNVGLIATRVSDGRDMVEDRHLAARSFWAVLDHPDVGRRRYPGNAIWLSETPVAYRMPAPRLGQHNDAILRDELGASEEDLAELRASGAISDVPIDPS